MDRQFDDGKDRHVADELGRKVVHVQYKQTDVDPHEMVDVDPHTQVDGDSHEQVYEDHEQVDEDLPDLKP